MRGFHNLLGDIKVTKNVGGPNCQIIANKIFHNLSKQSGEFRKPSKSR
jgi:hypothetical protein